MADIRKNLASVRERISAACLRAGRDPSEVTLVAVSKTMPPEDIETAISAGQTLFGENRVQELASKCEIFGSRAAFRQIGTLQVNKVKYLIGKVPLIESVDSGKLITEIGRLSVKAGLVTDILLEVNIGGEESKSGAAKEELPALLLLASQTPGVRVRGLMCIPPKNDDPEKTRPYFREMYRLFLDIGAEKSDNINMDILSMGMTHDFETAIEEGATSVRIGTGIFGPRSYMI